MNAVITNVAAAATHRFEVGDRVRAADTVDAPENYAEVVALTFRVTVPTDGSPAAAIPTYTLHDLHYDDEIEDVPCNADLVAK